MKVSKNKKRFFLTKQTLIPIIVIVCLLFLVYFLPRTSVSEEKDWVGELPTRPDIPEILEEHIFEDPSMEGLWYMPCGPVALYTAFAQLEKPVDFIEINKQRTGGFWRGFLSFFNKEAGHITWGHEMIEIPRGYGFEVEHLKTREATLENARRYSTNDSVVIIHMYKHLFAQHWEVYDTNAVKEVYESGQNCTSLDEDFSSGWKIMDLVVIKKS